MGKTTFEFGLNRFDWTSTNAFVADVRRAEELGFGYALIPWNAAGQGGRGLPQGHVAQADVFHDLQALANAGDVLAEDERVAHPHLQYVGN